MTTLKDLLAKLDQEILTNPKLKAALLSGDEKRLISKSVEFAILGALAECEPSKSESHTGYKTPYERQIFRNAQNMMLADYKSNCEKFLKT